MESRLIFLHTVMFLWRDGGLYLEHLIGLVLELRGGEIGKSVSQYSELSLNPRLRPRKSKEHASEKNFVWVKHNGSVPQTDTGGRVEKTKANE